MKTAPSLAARDARHCWHPYTQHGAESDPPLAVASAKDALLTLEDGRELIDAISSWWAILHGHGREELIDAMERQARKLDHVLFAGATHEPAVRLAERLCEIAPAGLTRVFYSDDGSTAVEVALKMAFQYHVHRGDKGRHRFAALGQAYHGDTVGSVSLGGIEVMHGVFDPLRFEVVRLPSPHCYRCPLGLERGTCAMECADEAEKILEGEAASLAGLVIEPLVQGAAGIIVHPPGYLSRMRAACDRLGILLIADEVAVGFGRTGTLFACSQEEVLPDLLCLAKGISGGYLPLAATLSTEEVFDAFLGPFDSYRAFFHGHTYTGNPLGCAAALASLDLLLELMPRLPVKVELLASLLDQHVAPLSHVGEVRQKGLMVGIELVQDRETKEPYDPSSRVGNQVILEARSRGVIIRPLGDVVVLMPGPAMAEQELELLVEVTARSIEEVTG